MNRDNQQEFEKLEKLVREVSDNPSINLVLNEDKLTELKEELEIEDNDGFKKYSSIENSYQEKYINFVAELNIKEWVISEKIHGSNSSICFDASSSNMELAKRSGYLNGESFYNLDKIVANMPQLESKFKEVCSKYGYKTIEVFGETFGGNYLHEDVMPAKDAKKVQKGVFYTPNNNFLAFDIRVDGEYVDVLKFQALCTELNVPFIPIETFSGDVYEAVEYCNTIKNKPSEIYKLYNLPEIKNNIREGVVLKPMITTRLGNGSRVIIKCKTEEFLEISKQHKPIIQKDLPEELQNALNKLAEYSTESRLNNVISHLGEVSIKDFGQVIGAFLQDIHEDFIKDGNSLNTFEKDEKKQLNKRLNSIIAPMVRKVLMTLS